MNKRLIRVLLACAVIVCGLWTIWMLNSLVKKYEANIIEIDELQTPVEIADKYMYDEYNGYWMDLDDVLLAGEDEHFSSTHVYELYAIKKVGEKKHELHYVIVDSSEYGISCRTVTDYPGTRIIHRWYEQEDIIPRIDCSVDVYGGDMTGWIDEYFELFYEDNQYYMCRDDGEMVRRYSETEVAEIEAKTGLTLEEMVDIAYDAQAKLEELIYDVKEQAKVIEKRNLILKLLFTCIPVSCFISAEVIFEIVMYRKRKKQIIKVD